MRVDSAGLPRIQNYAQALEHYESVKPFRSGTQRGSKPLGSNRRYKYLTIAQGTDESIYLQMCDSNVVTFHKDGHIIVSLCKYDTISTRQFIYATTYFDICHERGQTYLGVHGEWFAFENAAVPIIITPEGKVRNPKQEKIFRVNTKALNTRRKDFAPFREYVKNMGSVLVGIKETEVVPVAERHRSTFAEFNMLRDIRLRRIDLPQDYQVAAHRPSAEKYLHLFLREVEVAQNKEDLQVYHDMFILLGISALNYSASLHSFIVGRYWRYALQEVEIGSTMLNFFDEILKYVYREEVFEVVEVPIGKKVSNVNRKYFK